MSLARVSEIKPRAVPSRHRVYAIGLVALILTAGLKLALDPLVETPTPFLLLLGTAITAAWYGGFLTAYARLDQEAQEARAAAEATNGLKDEFLATLAHDLRTPLTAIVSWAHLLNRGTLSPDETVRAVDIIIRNASAQNQMIDKLLDAPQGSS
jgi:signal transduction histidine kinase